MVSEQSLSVVAVPVALGCCNVTDVKSRRIWQISESKNIGISSYRIKLKLLFCIHISVLVSIFYHLDICWQCMSNLPRLNSQMGNQDFLCTCSSVKKYKQKMVKRQRDVKNLVSMLCFSIFQILFTLETVPPQVETLKYRLTIIRYFETIKY